MKFKHTNFPIELTLPKLVRDKIPEIIKKEEKKEAVVRVAKNDKEYLTFVLKKIVEEAVETQHSKTKEDFINDIGGLETLLGEIVKIKKIKRSDIEKIKKLKLRVNGGFSQRLIFEGKK